MGIFSAVASGEYPFGAWDFIKAKEEAVQPQPVKITWGNHLHLQNMGKIVEEMVWHEKRKRFSSPMRQMDLYFGWMSEANDRRTRRMVGAYLFDYFVHVEFTEEEAEQIVKKEVEHEVETVYEFRFDKDIPSNSSFQFEAAMTQMTENPEQDYLLWIKHADPEKKAFALQYGCVSAKEKIKVKRSNMRHIYYTLFRAKKYSSRDFKHKVRSYLCTSVVYVNTSDPDDGYRRLGSRVTELPLLFSELDFYKLEEYKHLTPKQMEELVEEELEKHGFPRPTERVYSRGLHLIWKISPIPAYRAWEWELLQNKIHSILEKFGADSTTKNDKVRLLRMVGTIHEKTNKQIFGYTLTDDRYLFDDLIEKFCADEKQAIIDKREAARKRYAAKKEARLQVIEGGKKGKIQRSENDLKSNNNAGNHIHENYLRDLVMLVAIRDGKMDGYREFCCFLVRYWTLCITNGQKLRALIEMRNMYDSLDAYNKYTWEEMVAYTSSAEKAFERWKKSWMSGYNYKNDSLVKHFGITKEEQERMNYFIDDEESLKRRRKNKAKSEKKSRKEKGSVPNEVLEQTIREWLIKHPGVGAEKLAAMIREELGKCSKSKVLQVKKEMENDL